MRQVKIGCEAGTLAVRDDYKERIVATGIVELDREIGEGVLKWIQVSKDYRRRGLGHSVRLDVS